MDERSVFLVRSVKQNSFGIPKTGEKVQDWKTGKKWSQ